jgi:aquaporin Z
MPINHRRVLAAEITGTALLVVGGVGSAVIAGDRLDDLGIALAFGLSWLAAAWVVGPVSGCHVNPAVTTAMVLVRRTPVAALPTYLVGQLVGAVLGGGIVFTIAHGREGFDASQNGFFTNGWADRSPGGYNFGAMAVAEIVFTAVLVFVVLGASSRRFTPAQGGIMAGLALALVHLVTIPVDNTSVNPARSIATVVWSGNGDAWEQVWAFVVLPLLGAFVGVLVWLAVDERRLEDTLLDSSVLTAARDASDETVRLTTDALRRAGDELD